MSCARNLELDSIKIQELKDLLNSKLRTKISTMLPTDLSPILRHYDSDLVVSDVLSNPPHSSTHLVVLMASRKLILDMDLHLKNTHLILIAPLVVIVKKTLIKLDGEDGEQHPNKKAANSISKDERGKDGLEGNPGFSSGSISVYALAINNPQYLTIESNGGNGGDGQDGGDGKNGEIGENIVIQNSPGPRPVPTIPQIPLELLKGTGDDDLDDVVLCAAALNVASSAASTLAILACDQANRRTQTYLKENATAGGNGAKGGAGAPAGLVNFLIKDLEHQLYLDVNAVNGKSGAPGKGGKAGRNPVVPQGESSASPSDGIDCTTETAVAINPNYKYELNSQMIKCQLKAFEALFKEVDNSDGSADTWKFIYYLATCH